ncbi:MAG: diacylglycerol kinase family protein [Gemmatimonadota bacterium]
MEQSESVASRPQSAAGEQRRLAIILNARSGDGAAPKAQLQLEALFRGAGFDVRTTLAKDGDELRRGVEEAIAAKVEGVIAGGGDGTVSSVAGLLAGGSIPLGVIPLGTLNHFAKDLHIPLGLEDAAAVIIAGLKVRVDVGEVNGRVFVNNSSLGLYPYIVRLRQQRPARGPIKWAVAAWATLKALRQNRALAVRLIVDGKALSRGTPVILVGNNEYRMAGFDATARESLTGGHLALYIVKARRRGRLVRLGLKIFLGKAHGADELEMFRVDAATIQSKHRRLSVSRDGEVGTLDAPLEYRIRPADLSVFVPAPDHNPPSSPD